MEGIEFFVKILVFVLILSQWRRKEEEGQEFRSLEVRRNLIALKNTNYIPWILALHPRYSSSKPLYIKANPFDTANLSQSF
jgi:hypothetical protein